jgi:Response regulators consisting of a CheY-like receiver domain and a winged-helix DNA-binding domain
MSTVFTLSAKPRSVLLIDDDVELSQMLREYFAPSCIDLVLAHRASDAHVQLANRPFDLILLDLMLPDGNGLDLLRQFRRHSHRPVIMLTAHGSETDRVLGLEFGADDYLSKPFSPRELKARITAVLRRFESPPAPPVSMLSVGSLHLDPATGRAGVDDEQVALTGAEQRILEVLMRTPGQVVARDQISRYALGRACDRYDRSIDTHISTLRRKLGLDGSAGRPIIRNLRGLGYVLVESA